MNYSKDDLVLGLDIGYSFCKCVLMHRDGTTIKKFKFPTLIGITKANIEGVVNRDIIQYDSNYYFVGERAKHLPTANIIDITEYKNLEYYAPLLAYCAMGVAGVLEIGVSKLVSGLSIAQIQNSGYFQEALSHFVVNGTEFHNEVLLLPQGAGVKLAFDKFGAFYPTEQREFLGESTYVIVDIGFNTTDLLLIDSGKTDPNLFEGIEKSGIMKIATQMAKIINEKHQRTPSLGEAREILDTGIYKLRGQKHNYTNEVKELKDAYLKEILTIVNEKYGSILDKADFIVVGGGGAYLFKDSQDGFIKVIHNDAEYYNAIGEALFALNN